MTLENTKLANKGEVDYMAINFNKIQIDEELEELLPALSEEDYKALEDLLLKNGFNEQFGRIRVW